MTLELSRLTKQVQAMGQALATRQEAYAHIVEQARRWLSEYAAQAAALRRPARQFSAAIPTVEPIDAHYALGAAPERFTFIAADGAEIQPDSHGIAYYYLINVGAMVYRHGSGQTPQAYSQPQMGYSEEDVYEFGQPVTGNLLDIRRDLAEITCLADLCAAEPAADTIAVVDGTLILWTLKDMPPQYQAQKVEDYVAQLDRIRETGALVAACISRPRRGEVTRLLHLAHAGGDVKQAKGTENPLRHLPDYAIFESLPPGARSALFVSPSTINHTHYGQRGHTVHFFYINLARQADAPAIARVEVPLWVAEDADRLTWTHSAIVAQARVTGNYPYALVRADELAFISSRERAAFEEMVARSLTRAGVPARLSPKQTYKAMTRHGRRKFR